MGSIVSAKNENWKEHEVKLIIENEKKGIYYSGNKSKEVVTKVELITNNLLKINDYYLIRTFQNEKPNRQISEFIKVAKGTETYWLSI